MPGPRADAKPRPVGAAKRTAAARSAAPAGPPLDVYLRRRRSLRWLAGVALLLGVILLSWADHRGWLLYAGDDLARYDGKAFRVTRVIDGDTLDVAERDGRSPRTRVRFWGIDTPEIAHEGWPHPAEPFGDEAAAFTRERTEGKTVVLHLEAHRPRDRYGRLLAHVELPGGASLSEGLLAAGLAQADTRWSHSRMDRYAELERAAKDAGVGLWAKPKR